jgi:hypothetical protein
MMSTNAMKNLSLKDDFLTYFIQESKISPDAVFKRLRVTYDYTQHEEIDAVIMTSYKVYLFELITWTGQYEEENDTAWIRSETMESVGVADQAGATPTESTKVTIMKTKIPNPCHVAQRKVKALLQYIESHSGPHTASHFDYFVIFIRQECSLNENCLSFRTISYSNMEMFMRSFRLGWKWWLLERAIPIWPVWIGGYTDIMKNLMTIPVYDVIVLNSANKLYGELRSCPGVPYDRQTTSQLQFTTTKAGLVFGKDGINVTSFDRTSGSKQLEIKLDKDSKLEFLCVEADGPMFIALTDVHIVALSVPSN